MKVKRILLKAIDVIACTAGSTGLTYGIVYGVAKLWTWLFDMSDEAIEAHPILGVLKVVGFVIVTLSLGVAAVTLVWEVIFGKVWDFIDEKFPDKKEDFK